MTTASFQVGLGRHLLTETVLGTPGLARGLGGLESAWLRSRIGSVDIHRPVWISGLARSGTTILLEFLAALPGVATHQYRDFPFLHTPWWWRTFLDRASPPTGRGNEQPRERAHADGIRVTPRSPEAMEEVLWMSFFDRLHDPGRSQVLERAEVERRPEFLEFFRDHIRKLLLVEGAERYVAKANYNLTRLPFVQEAFPDARFVVPIRSPEAHVASLRKQHRLFLEAAEEHPRSLAHLDRVGHFEFGAHRRPVHAGDPEAVARIQADWREREELRGWARYWAHLYGWVADRLAADERLAQAVLLVSYEELCRAPARVLRRILAHTGFDREVAEVVDRFAARIRLPSYYEPDFTEEERAMIESETASTRQALAALEGAA